jgi:hypothetical protein
MSRNFEIGSTTSTIAPTQAQAQALKRRAKEDAAEKRRKAIRKRSMSGIGHVHRNESARIMISAVSLNTSDC